MAVLPPIRKLIKPDPGYVLFDIDMSGADAQVVAWEADDKDLMAAFKKGLKIHVKNFEDMYQEPFLPEHKLKVNPGRLYTPYDEMKRGVHGCNYGVTSRNLATTLSWTTKEAEDFKTRWFQLHPGIKQWHRRIEQDLQLTRTIRNKFGYRIIYFDRPENCFNEALAWTPQSTVGIIAARGAVALHKNFPFLQVLMQVHDSLVFQLPYFYVKQSILEKIKETVEIPVPYPEPLVIPWGIAASKTSWGECSEIKWTGEGLL